MIREGWTCEQLAGGSLSAHLVYGNKEDMLQMCERAKGLASVPCVRCPGPLKARVVVEPRTG